MSINNVKNSRKWFLTAVMSLLFCVGAIAQSQVSGTVVDQTGEPVIGAYVTLDGDNSVGTITDFDGYYEISVPSDAKLIFSFMGYESQTLSVAGKSTLDVTLAEETTKLDEVVAIGYGSQKAKEVTSSVTSVKSEDFNAGVKGNPMGLLQGKVAGLNISKTGGDPTSTGYNIQIRGFSTLNQGAGSSPLYIVDGVPVSNIDNISPDEIASMDVLKDGSAAAIYGTRGTNGVIIITTKRSNGEAAECGVSSVEYSGYVSYAAAHRNTGMATPEQFRNLESISGGKVVPVIFEGDYNTDWVGALLNPAPITHSHNVAISGNTKNFGYRGSVMFKDANGVAINSGRQEIMAKMAADQKLLQGWLKLQYDFSYMHYRNDFFDNGNFQQAATLNPTYPIYSDTEESGYYLATGSGEVNPVASAKLRESYQEGNYFRGSVKATVDIKAVPGLKINAFAALEEGDNYDYYYRSQLYSEDEGEAGKAERKTSRNFSQLYEATIDYSGSWNGHNVAAVAGFSYQNFFYDGSNMSNSGFPTDNYKYYSMYDGDASKQLMNIGSYRNSNTLMSMFARVNYNYNEKYLISASIRREGSSRFGENNKWGWFPAVSAGWRISGEDFMADQTWCNDMKLRVGFGITGNNLGSDLKSKQLLTTGGTFWYNGEWITTYCVNQNANPDLRWEKKYEYNVGIDFAFLNNRLNGTIDLYYRDTKDLLWKYNVPTPPYQFSELLANCGEVVSKGIEISLTGVPVLTKDWNWTTGLTLAFNDNKIVKLSDPALGLNYSEMLTGSVGENGLRNVNTQKIVEGESVGTFYGYKVIGITDKGALKYEKDADGKDKLQVIGHAQPLFTYGWNNTVRWKNLDLTLFFRGVYGNDILNVKRWAYGPSKSQGMNVFIKDVEALANGTGAYRQGKFSDYYLEDGSYLKLDNITLGYNVPLKPNKYVQSLRVYATAENVFTITSYSGIDPEVNTSSVEYSGIDGSGFYPSVTNVMLGLNVVF